MDPGFGPDGLKLVVYSVELTLTWTKRWLVLTSALVVCLAPLQAQTAAAAKVIERAGMVSIMESGYAKALSVGMTVGPQQIIVTGPDSFARFQVLSDGSTFEVYANSKVVFRETLGDWKHLLNLWIGRVKVFIQHAPGVPNPNNVTTPTAVISVRGTVFDVVVRDDDGTTDVAVDEGAVAVRNVTAPGSPVVLGPGDTITVFKGQPLMGHQIDKGNLMRNALRVVRDTVYQVLLNRQAGAIPGPGGSGGPVGGSTGGAQGDKGKTGGGTTTTPGAPPAPPGAPPPPPGGGG
jgi:hypothetical protein